MKFCSECGVDVQSYGPYDRYTVINGTIVCRGCWREHKKKEEEDKKSLVKWGLDPN